MPNGILPQSMPSARHVCYVALMPAVTRTLSFVDIRKRVLLFALFALITLAPLTVRHTQLLTGPLVNMMLLLTCAAVGPTEALFLGLLPSPTALVSGLLPLPLAPMLPFIMIGNALYVLAFHLLRARSPVGGVVAGSVLKYVFLVFAARFLSAALLAPDAVPLAAKMMGVAQLVTALGGGALALIALRFLPRRD